MVFSPDGNSLAAVNDQDQVISFDVATGKPLDAFPAARASSNPLVFSPDGATLATMDGDQALHFWDRATGNDRLATPDSHRDPVSLIKFIDSGKTLLSLGRDQSIRFWNTSTGTLSKSLTCDGSPHPFSFARRDDGMTVAAAVYGDLQEARVWDLQTQKLLWAYTAQPAEPDQDLFVYHVQLSPDASSVTTLLSDGSLRCWDVATGKERSAAQVKSLRRPDWDWTEIGTASCSPDARSIAVATQTGDIAMIDIPTGNVRFRTPASIQDPEDISKVRRNVPLQFAPDGQGLAFTKRIYNKINRAGGSTHTQWPRDTTLTWVDAQSGKTRREILIPEENVGRPTFSPDGQLIAVSASSSDDHNSIRIFRLRDKIEIQKIETGAAQIYSLAFTPDGSQIAAGLSDTSIVLWNVKKRD
jgi:WD40 repeat protein